MAHTRRRFLVSGAAAFGLAACHRNTVSPTAVGASRRPYGDRSPFETTARLFQPGVTPGTGSSRTPLQDARGIITPSSLHFERHHAGVPTIDPRRHTLLIHGSVSRPLTFTMEDLVRFPSCSRMHFIECAGNSAREHEGRPGATVQQSHGLVSCSEWTGVMLSTLLGEVGLQSSATWIIAEGADACRLARSIPLQKAMTDVMVAYGQNGEALRPEQGYPLRLLVPGWEGNVNIKWLHRLHISNQPAMTREEAATYTDLMPNGVARQFTFEMDVKSVITRPSGGHVLPVRGPYEISGIAWSGRGRVSRVEISVGDSQWYDSTLSEPVLTKAFTRFTLPWTWDGRDTRLRSRATDETGDRQPEREELITVRGLHPGPDGFNHYNGIKEWHVQRDGTVSHV